MAMKRALILSALFVLAGVSHASSYHAIGMGLQSCGTWTAYRRNNQALGSEQWLLGFLSGVGYKGEATGNDPMKGLDANAVWGWMDNWCRDHPLSDLADSAAAFNNRHPQ
jgi:hypothetical protein